MSVIVYHRVFSCYQRGCADYSMGFDLYTKNAKAYGNRSDSELNQVLITTTQ